MPPSEVPEPWASFLSGLDAALNEETQLCCVGGFAITVQYGLQRPTSDMDVLSIAPQGQMPAVLDLAGEGGNLYKKYGLYIELLGAIVTLPENYTERVSKRSSVRPIQEPSIVRPRPIRPCAV